MQTYFLVWWVSIRVTKNTINYKTLFGQAILSRNYYLRSWLCHINNRKHDNFLFPGAFFFVRFQSKKKFENFANNNFFLFCFFIESKTKQKSHSVYLFVTKHKTLQQYKHSQHSRSQIRNNMYFCFPLFVTITIKLLFHWTKQLTHMGPTQSSSIHWHQVPNEDIFFWWNSVNFGLYFQKSFAKHSVYTFKFHV